VPQNMGIAARRRLRTGREKDSATGVRVSPNRRRNYRLKTANMSTTTINMASIVKKRFDLQITTAGAVHSQSFELDKTISFVKGILITSSKDDLLYYRGSQRIELNRQELFPEGYESKLLMSGINCSPNVRYYQTGQMPIGNGILKVEYKDTDDSRAFFEPYRVSVYLDCELSQYGA
jgi:hypothetical protein